MFTFSDVHAWQGEVAVQQILVFKNAAAQKSFESLFQQQAEIVGQNSASDSGIGALYKLRSVKDGADKFVPMVRDGKDGKFLWEDESVETVEQALEKAKDYFQKVLAPLHSGTSIEP